MLEFFFKYPASVFRKGNLLLLGGWPGWVLVLAIIAAAALLALHVRRSRARLTPGRGVAIWALEATVAALLLTMLWRPALSVSTLEPQQNLVAVVVDSSRSMATADSGGTRADAAARALGGGLIDSLSKRFQVRVYRMGHDAARVGGVAELGAGEAATHIGQSLDSVLADASGLPLGAIVLASDGGDNSGGIERETITRLRARRVPVHTVGFGRERPARDVEIAGVALPPRALEGARLSAEITLRQFGYAGRKARLSIRDGGRVLASREVTLKADGVASTEPVPFQASGAGARNLTVAVEPLEQEENTRNNAVARLVSVEAGRPRILYIEGEPRWEMKFIRRAIEEDKTLELTSMLRTTQNKIYRQGIANPAELEKGFPSTAEDLFAYQGLIIGNVEANYFTPSQRELISEFAARRGGGVLFLGGRATLGDGGYAGTPLEEMLPVRLAGPRGTFRRDEAQAELAPAGGLSQLCRLDDNPERNLERWKKMPPLADYQETGELKPGAVAMLETGAGARRRTPLLAVETFGRGRTAVLATSGTWRWQMLQPLEDKTHETFWQQMGRWLVAETPGTVMASAPKPVLEDDSRTALRAEVRDKTYSPVADAIVQAHVVGPDGATSTVDLSPAAGQDGVYAAEWSAEKPGSYVAELVARRGEQELGRHAVMFRREDGVAEGFRLEQNRELLEKLSSETGGRYYKPEEAAKLGGEIAYSEAGITTRDTRELWDMPALFALLLALRGAEWMLRRKWGVV